ncbi:MAG TPA: hypothetical protein VFG95_10235, partial [Nitrospiria bacterium]|nr:hypothetical protein [Nitrospiria bacterium]
MPRLSTVFKKLLSAPGIPGWAFGFGVLLLIAACSRADFPFCCDLSGTSDVPLVKTYDFNFRSGFSTLSSPASNLTVATAADLANFLAAANLQQNTSTGTISGVLIDSAGTFIQGLRIGVFDDAGDPIKDFFYNSLGGVPDFSNTSGATDTTGSFSIFNALPGQVHVRILHGGRGNARVLSFAGAISLMASQALPAVPDSVPITGVVNDIDTGAPVPGVQIFALGVNGLGPNGTIATANSNGGYNIPEPRTTASGFGPSLVSNGSYYMKISASGYRTSYQVIATNPAAIQAGTTDLTVFFKLQSESELSKEATSIGYPLRGDTTLLEGVIRETDGTPRPAAEIDLRDVDGNPVGDVYYRTDSPVPALDRLLVKVQPNGTKGTSNNGEFFVFFSTPPPSKVYLSAVSTLASLDTKNPNKYSASREITLFPASVSYVDPFIIPENALDDNDPSFIPSNSELVTGKVLNISGNPVGDVNIAVLGFSGTLGISGDPTRGPGKYTLPNYSYFSVCDPNGPNYQSTPCGPASPTIDDYRAQRIQYYPFPNDPEYPALKFCTPSYYGTELLTPTKKEPDCALVANAGYVLRLSPPPSSSEYFETYEKILLDNNHDGNIRNLILPSRDELGGQAPTPGKGIVVGTLFIQGSIRTASGITLAANDEEGNPIGDIYYFDDQSPPQIVQADQSFNNGRFAVANIPVSNGERRIYISVISSDDSGAASVRVQENAVTVSDLVVSKSP